MGFTFSPLDAPLAKAFRIFFSALRLGHVRRASLSFLLFSSLQASEHIRLNDLRRSRVKDAPQTQHETDTMGTGFGCGTAFTFFFRISLTTRTRPPVTRINALKADHCSPHLREQAVLFSARLGWNVTPQSTHSHVLLRIGLALRGPLALRRSALAASLHRREQTFASGRLDTKPVPHRWHLSSYRGG